MKAVPPNGYSKASSAKIRGMNMVDLHPQYVTDENGIRKSVLLPIEEYYELLEDLDDQAAIAERKNDPSIPFEQAMQDLGIDGQL